MFSEREKRNNCSSDPTCENPWDGTSCPRSRVRSVPRYTALIVLTVILSLLLLVSYSHSQTPVAPETEPVPKVAPAEKVNRIKANRIARDYLEIMEQLAELTRDYRNSYRSYQTAAAKENFLELKALLAQLNENSARQKPAELSKHLKELAKKLERQESELRLSQAEKSLQSATRSLNQEITILNELLDSEVLARMEKENFKQEEMHFFITQQAYDDLNHKVELILINEDNGELTVSVREIVSPPGKVPEPPAVVKSPKPIPVPRFSGSNFIYGNDRGRTHLIREFTDSILNPAARVVVEINSQAGQVDISGWPYNKVVASYKIELSMPDEISANELAENINLSCSYDNDRIQVMPHLPNLDNLQTRVISSKLSVMVPSSNAVIVKTVFGKVFVSDLTKSLKIDSRNCTLVLNNIDGEINIISKFGSTALSEVSGNIFIKSLMGPVIIDRSDGNFTIENSLESVEITSSKGDVYVNTSGHVLVENHRGNVTIKNHNGEVEIRRLDGDLLAHNSYRPMLIESVTGKVEIYNLYAAIEASKIDGQLTVNNKFGDITVSDLKGAIFLTNQNGIINVTLADQLVAGSSIFAAFAEINLSIAERSNVDLMVTSIGGQIRNYFPVDIVEKGNHQSVRHLFGRGNASLEVIGKHSDINISESF